MCLECKGFLGQETWDRPGVAGHPTPVEGLVDASGVEGEGIEKAKHSLSLSPGLPQQAQRERHARGWGSGQLRLT